MTVDITRPLKKLQEEIADGYGCKLKSKGGNQIILLHMNGSMQNEKKWEYNVREVNRSDLRESLTSGQKVFSWEIAA